MRILLRLFLPAAIQMNYELWSSVNGMLSSSDSLIIDEGVSVAPRDCPASENDPRLESCDATKSAPAVAMATWIRQERKYLKW